MAVVESDTAPIGQIALAQAGFFRDELTVRYLSGGAWQLLRPRSDCARLKDGALAAFVDPRANKKYVADKEEAFKAELAKQRAALPQ